MYFWVLGVFCIIIYYFLCIHRILCHFLYIWTYFKDAFQHCLKNVQKCEQFSYQISFCDFVICCPTPHPPPSPASMSKFPSGGGKIWKNMFLMIFCDFDETKLKKCTKMFKSCSIRRVGRIVYWQKMVRNKFYNQFKSMKKQSKIN